MLWAMQNGGSPQGLSDKSPRPVPTLSRELGGDLPCARCKYNLRGLSIRSVCPECGLPIKATLLARLDPRAGELRPITRPRLVAAGVAVWGVAPVVAALLTAYVRLVDVFGVRVSSRSIEWSMYAVVGLAALSGLGAGVLVRPHDGDAARKGGASALAGALLYVPLVLTMAYVLLVVDRGGWGAGVWGSAYGGEAAHDVTRLALHAISNVLIMLIAVLLRPNARLLAARSLLMRAGRVDRQTLRAVAAVLGIALAGDVLRLIGWQIPGGTGQLLDQAGQALVLVGSALFTLGLVGVAVDCVRLVPVILDPPLTLGQVLGDQPSPPRDESEPRS